MGFQESQKIKGSLFSSPYGKSDAKETKKAEEYSSSVFEKDSKSVKGSRAEKWARMSDSQKYAALKNISEKIARGLALNPEKAQNAGSSRLAAFASKNPEFKQLIKSELSKRKGSIVAKLQTMDQGKLLNLFGEKLMRIDSQAFSKEKMVTRGINKGDLSDNEAKKYLADILDCDSQDLKDFSAKSILKFGVPDFKSLFAENQKKLPDDESSVEAKNKIDKVSDKEQNEKDKQVQKEELAKKYVEEKFNSQKFKAFTTNSIFASKNKKSENNKKTAEKKSKEKTNHKKENSYIEQDLFNIIANEFVKNSSNIDLVIANIEELTGESIDFDLGSESSYKNWMERRGCDS